MINYHTFLDQAEPSSGGIPFFPSGSHIIPPIISGVSTAFVITVAITFKLYKSPLGIMILGINLSDFFYALIKSIAVFLPIKNDLYCKFLVFIGNATWRASLVWGVCFGHALLMTVRHKGTNILKNLIKLYFILSITIPMGLSVLNWFFGYVVYEPETSACVVKTGNFERYAFLKVMPGLVGVIMSSYWYTKAVKTLTKLKVKKYWRVTYVVAFSNDCDSLLAPSGYSPADPPTWE